MDFLASPTIIGLLLTGALVGFIAGLVGIGGGVLFIPILLFLLPPDITPVGERLPFVFGTTIAVGWLTALVSSSVHRRKLKNIGRAGLVLGLAAVIGAQGGVATAAALPAATLETIFAVILLIVAPLLAVAPEPGEADVETSGAGADPAEGGGGGTPVTSASLDARHSLYLVILGLFTGFFSATVGLGGAIFATPALILLLRYPSLNAMGMSTMMMSLTAASATIGFIIHGWGIPGLPPASLGYVNLLIVAALAITSMPLARIGASLAHRVNVRWLRGILAVILAVVAVRMLVT